MEPSDPSAWRQFLGVVLAGNGQSVFGQQFSKWIRWITFFRNREQPLLKPRNTLLGTASHPTAGEAQERPHQSERDGRCDRQIEQDAERQNDAAGKGKRISDEGEDEGQQQRRGGNECGAPGNREDAQATLQTLKICIELF